MNLRLQNVSKSVGNRIGTNMLPACRDGQSKSDSRAHPWPQTVLSMNIVGLKLPNVFLGGARKREMSGTAQLGASLCFDVRKPLRSLQPWGALRQHLHEAPFMSLLLGQLSTLTKPPA